MVKPKKHGGRSQEVKAVDCGSTTRGFESHRPPSKKPLILEISGFLAFESFSKLTGRPFLCYPD